jgi:hypothetical protein
MLTQKQKEMPYIAVFKTGAGEEFIGKVVDETMASYAVSTPLCMVGTQKGLQFAPFLMMADPDKPITIPKPVIVATPAPQLEAQYESATTGIALPKKSAIIT